MKKNTRIVSMAAAALLAVAPVAASAVPVNAAISLGTVTNTTGTTSTTTATTAKPTDRSYFTYGNQVIDAASTTNKTANVVPTTISIKVKDTVASVTKSINDLGLVFFSTNNASGEKVSLKDSEVAAILKNAGVTLDKDNKNITAVPTSDFNLTLTGTGSTSTQTATVQIPVVVSGSSSTTDTTQNPVINWSLNGQSKGSVNGQIFQVAVGSQFNPTNFVNSNGEPVIISAVQNSNNNTAASLEATSNPVNTSEAGRYYNVTLTATGLTGKKTTATYTVLITSSQKQILYANGASSIATYRIYANNVLSGSTTFKDGDQVYVADQTRTIDNVSYSQVSTKSKSDANSSNIWVKTSSLVKPAGDTNTKTLPVMVDSRAYDKNGNYLGHMYYAYNDIEIVPTIVTINGKTYYKVANKDEYVRVTNITGNQRTLKHNAYIYWSSYRRTPGTGKMYRGQTVTTYGGQMRFKNGKKYYRIEGCRNNNKRYIKAVNFY